ncbi:uncharacterized protein [Paramormyrops kingsleyae]|uniref:uncharacterized protein n=1 Tax=Paramormyrops kingsleyae TaxID=1676925 RepID=UPI003B970222
MNPLKPSLEFVREREKARLFFRELSEAGLSGQTQANYLKSLKRFLKYHTVITDLRHDSRGLWNNAKFFMEELNSLQLSCAKLVTKEISQRRHAILTEKNPLNPEDCWAVLRAAKHDFLAIVGKVYPEETPLELKECCLLLYYLEAIVILKHLQQRGVVEHMTVQEWMKRTRDESGYTVIGVKEHRSSTRRVAAFALSSEEEKWFETYFSHVRPQLLASNWSKRTTNQQGGDERFFVSTSGRPIYNASNDLHRLHQRYQLDPVTSQTARQVFGTASKNMTDSEKTLVADYLSHSAATAQDVVAASKLLSKLAGDLSASSAEEGTIRATRGAVRSAAPGSNQRTDVQAAYDRLLQTHPVTLDGDVPDRTVRSQTSGQFQRQLYERWLKAQMKLRVKHVLSHFGRREPTESRVSAWIKKQGWKSNVPSAARILKDWKPTGSVKTAMDSRRIQKLITTQKWKGLVVVDIVGKGKSVCTTRHFQAGEVVCDYHGRVVTATEGWQIHQATTEEQTGYMFFFKNSKNNHMCIDAHAPQCECHPKKQTFGRLINHSRKKANIRPRLYTMEMDGKEQDVILFLAQGKIDLGEELRFDFGVERKSFRGEGLDLFWL